MRKNAYLYQQNILHNNVILCNYTIHVINQNSVDILNFQWQGSSSIQSLVVAIMYTNFYINKLKLTHKQKYVDKHFPSFLF